MSRSLRFDDPYVPVPPAAIDADPATTIAELFFRVARLEQSLQAERLEAQAEQGETLLAQVEISDALVRLVESIGVPTSAQQAMLVRGVAALGQRFMDGLRRWGVTPIEALGRPPDRETSDVAGYEPGPDVPDGTVLREELSGYLWRGTVLRRARVIVSGRAPVGAPSAQVAPHSGPGHDRGGAG